MIASNTNNANRHKNTILRRSAVQPKPANTLSVASITSYGADKAKIVLSTLVEGDLWSGCKVSVATTTSHNGLWEVASADITNKFIVVKIPNGHLLPDQAGAAGTVVLFDAVKDFTLPGTPLHNDTGELIAETYSAAGSFVVTANNSTAIHLVVTDGSISATFQASLDRVNWATLNTSMSSVTTSSIVFFNDIPAGTYIRVNTTGTGTYYLLARG